MPWFVYILRCGDDTLYTGITNKLEERILKHEKGKGAKYTRGRSPFTLIHSEECADRSEATRREAQIKGLNRVEKLKLANLA